MQPSGKNTDAIVTVDLGEKAYPIIIGSALLERAEEFLSPLLSRPKIFVVTDENVERAQGARFTDGLGANIDIATITLRPGEKTKNFSQLASLVEDLVEAGIERNDLIIAFGGGVVGDITGFSAAITKRGCRFVQVPTTLLSQVDSSVGGKTGINIKHGKNLAGVFFQPELVLCDLDSLDTLSPREVRAGYAEIVKYGAIGDEPFFRWLEENSDSILKGNRTAQTRAVKVSCETKARIVASDEREKGERALLNLGHTFGHALENAYEYSGALLHGEAVAAGMGMAFDFSTELGLCAQESADRLKSHLRHSHLPTGITDLPPNEAINADNIFASMLRDKKNTDNSLTLILATNIGAAKIVKDAPKDKVKTFLRKKCA